jgi:hypothetical protein
MLVSELREIMKKYKEEDLELIILEMQCHQANMTRNGNNVKCKKIFPKAP